jgi:hypothetical protein
VKSTKPLVLALLLAPFPALADTTITAVPYTISATGTYVLASNLTSDDPTNPAITINANQLTGSVTLNLMGHSLESAGTTLSVGVEVVGGSPENGYNKFPVTVKNGTIVANQGVTADYINSLTIENVKIELIQRTQAMPPPVAISSQSAANMLVKNCVFNGPSTGWLGIGETDSPAGNHYQNITLQNPVMPILVNSGSQTVSTITNCHFGAGPIPPLIDIRFQSKRLDRADPG